LGLRCKRLWAIYHSGHLKRVPVCRGGGPSDSRECRAHSWQMAAAGAAADGDLAGRYCSSTVKNAAEECLPQGLRDDARPSSALSAPDEFARCVVIGKRHGSHLTRSAIQLKLVEGVRTAAPRALHAPAWYSEPAGNVAVDQSPDYRGGDGRARDARPFPFRLAGDAEQQQARGGAERFGLSLLPWADRSLFGTGSNPEQR
jgi:hypothetical protein